jgi:hypothetical protein
MRFWAGMGATTADEVGGEGTTRDRRLVEEATTAVAEVIVTDLL